MGFNSAFKGLKQNLQQKTKHGRYKQHVFPKIVAVLSINKSQRTRHNCYAAFPRLVHSWYEHLSLVNGALAQIWDNYRFPPTVGKCNTSQRNHVRLFTIQAEMFAFPPPVCTRQRHKWPVDNLQDEVGGADKHTNPGLH